MQTARRITAGLQLALLSCVATLSTAQTGGDIAGLVPAPKVLSGKIEESVYISPKKDFKIALPHKEGTYEFQYMQIKEQSHDLSTYVSFGPAALDRRVFRVEVTKYVTPTTPAVEQVSEQLFQSYISQVEKAYNTPCQRLVTKPSAFSNGKGVFTACAQHIQARRRFLQPDIAGETRLHALYILDYGTHAAIFWVEVPQADNKTQEAITNAQYAPILAFVESLALQPTQ